MNTALAERHRRDWRPWRRGDDPTPQRRAAEVDAGHLGERLGLFVIIVLGEAMLQVVGAVVGDRGLAAGRRRSAGCCCSPSRPRSRC